MRQNRQELLALVLGMALLLLSIKLNKALDFTPFYLIGNRREWEIGSREIAHLVGLAGFTVMVWYFIRSFAYKRLVAINLAMMVSVAVAAALAWPEHDLLFDLLGVNALEVAFKLMPILLSGWIWCAFIAWKTPNLVKPLPALVSSSLVLVATIALWEFYVQPFDNVYGGPPRGWIEKGQVVFDFVGVLVGALIVLRFHGWPGPLHADQADNLNRDAQPLEP
jgi:hypothetical protein